MNQIALSIDIEDWYHSRHVTSLDKNPNEQILDFKNKYNKNYKYLEKPIDLFQNFKNSRQIELYFYD